MAAVKRHAADNLPSMSVHHRRSSSCFHNVLLSENLLATVSCFQCGLYESLQPHVEACSKLSLTKTEKGKEFTVNYSVGGRSWTSNDLCLQYIVHTRDWAFVLHMVIAQGNEATVQRIVACDKSLVTEYYYRSTPRH